jgi:hypothetical protein
METLAYNSALTGFRRQAQASPLAEAPAVTGGGNDLARGRRKGPR